jgi:RNA polymerase sigma-70 factor (ECF subfamily)
VQELTHEPEEAAAQDAGLVSSVLSGDSAAFDRLVRRYQRRAVAVAYRLLGNSHDAADVAQDAFLRAYRALQSLEDQRRFGPWLMRIVTNLSLNFRRSRETGVARSAAALEDLVETPRGFRSPDGDPRLGEASPPDSALSSDLRTAIGQAIERLPDKQRLALVLYSIEGLPQKEVAQILECSVELVKWNVFQARKTLRRELAHYVKA